VRGGVLSSISSILLAEAALLAPAAPAQAAAARSEVWHRPAANARGHTSRSSANWAGYDLRGTTFTSVSGEWQVPAVSCPTRTAQYSSAWLGIDGDGSGTVEQIGTESDCSGASRPSYYAWYELYPAASVRIGMSLHPGDSVSASVSASGTTYTLTIVDTNSGARYSATKYARQAQGASAEWVVEAPASCSKQSCKPLPLANFGAVNFSACYAAGGGTRGSITDRAWSADQLVLNGPSGTLEALPSAPSPDGSAFSVTASGGPSSTQSSSAPRHSSRGRSHRSRR
jgi:opacity protein-like surface antigen